MPTPPEWVILGKRLREMLNGIDKMCRHRDRYYVPHADPWHTRLEIRCANPQCDLHLGFMG